MRFLIQRSGCTFPQAVVFLDNGPIFHSILPRLRGPHVHFHDGREIEMT